MTESEALDAAVEILRRNHGDISPRDARKLGRLERQFPGVVNEAAVQTVDTHQHTGRRESKPCELVDQWAKLRWKIPKRAITRPDALGELVALLSEAKQRGTTLRMVGAARSPSLACTPSSKGSLVAGCNLDAVLEIGDVLADGVDPETLYRCEAGRVAKDVIDDLQDAGLALANMGSGQFQGIVGAIMTATHGSGLALPDMSGQTVAMQIVTTTTPARWWSASSPARASSTPRSSRRPTPTTRSPSPWWRTRTNFLAAVVSFGCLGLVYSVTLRAVPQYYLHEERVPDYWSRIKHEVLDEARSIRNYELLINPLPVEVTPKDGPPRMDHEVLVTRRRLVEATEPSGHRNIKFTWPAPRWATGPLASCWTRPSGIRSRWCPRWCTPPSPAPRSRATPTSARKVLQLNLDLNADGSELEVPVEHAVAAVDLILERSLATGMR